MSGYLVNAVEPVPLVLDLHIDHDRFGSSSDPNIYGHLHYRNDLDGSLNEDVTDKIRQYRFDNKNRPSNSISFVPAIASTLGVYIVNWCSFHSYRLIGKLTSFL